MNRRMATPNLHRAQNHAVNVLVFMSFFVGALCGASIALGLVS